MTRSSGRAPSAGVPNSPSSTPLLASSIVVPSSAVTSRPFHSRPIPRSASATAASSSKILCMTCSPSSFLAWENALPEGTSAPGRGPQAGQPERRRQHRVIAGAGEQARDQHADHGHLRGQHPVILMARGRLPQRAGDHAVGEQVFQQALPAQLRQPLRPEPRPGRDPGGHLRGPVVIPLRRGRSGRRRDDHGKLGRQQSSRWTVRASTTQFLPGALFYFRDRRIPSRRRDQHAARP